MLRIEILILVSVLGLINGLSSPLSEKKINAQKDINATCLEILHNTNASLMDRCEFFKCFEERFPCGSNYWIMNWGYKYCRRYADPKFIATFNEAGQKLLNGVNKCLPKKFEKFYRKKSVRCRRLFNEAFDEQVKCYAEIKEIFCQGFSENRLSFIRVLDQSDLMLPDSIAMIKKAVDGCDPKIDFMKLL